MIITSPTIIAKGLKVVVMQTTTKRQFPLILANQRETIPVVSLLKKPQPTNKLKIVTTERHLTQMIIRNHRGNKSTMLILKMRMITQDNRLKWILQNTKNLLFNKDKPWKTKLIVRLLRLQGKLNYLHTCKLNPPTWKSAHLAEGSSMRMLTRSTSKYARMFL